MPGPDGGQAKGVDDAMTTYMRSLSANGVPVPQIAQKPVISPGQNVRA
ncbi:hypothetical protein [Streptomyces sp. Root369]|nr:hypothetical protein [Streptomyces sp. Root369]